MMIVLTLLLALRFRLLRQQGYNITSGNSFYLVDYSLIRLHYLYLYVHIIWIEKVLHICHLILSPRQRK
jgi:hypothetical protein